LSCRKPHKRPWICLLWWPLKLILCNLL